MDTTPERVRGLALAAGIAGGLLAAGLAARPAWALEPQEVLVVANELSRDSVELARHYAARRSIDPRNIVLIRTTTEPLVNRTNYEAQIRQPIRKALAERKLKETVQSVCLMWGVPVMIAAVPRPGRPTGEGTVGPMEKTDSSVDSELALLWWDQYPLEGPIRNPLYWRSGMGGGPRAAPVVMACRIDGPSASDAMRIVKASLAAEETGLDGVFYIDAGGPDIIPAGVRAQYDGRLRQLGRFVSANTSLKCVVDDKPTVFAPDSCPRAAMYVGWYSLRKYVPAFMWTPGAVGWHISSWEATHLRDPDSQEWCPRMIQNGVAATLGAVSEPLLNHFPHPEEFFPLLLTGKYTVAECYWRTVPAASWQMTLIADPLYNPFKSRPQVKVADLPAGLAP